MPTMPKKLSMLALWSQCVAASVSVYAESPSSSFRSPTPGNRRPIPQRAVVHQKKKVPTRQAERQKIEAPPAEHPAGVHFRVADMPNGAEVTLPPSSSILLAAGMRTKVAPTTSGQMMKVSLAPTAGAEGQRTRQISVFDQNQDRVRQLKVQEGQPAIYAFSDLDPIVLLPEGSSANGDPGVTIDSLMAITVGR